MNLLALAAGILFIVGAILALLVEGVGHDVLMGILFAGLACWVFSSLVSFARRP